MFNFKRISVDQARKIITEQPHSLIDIRDEGSFNQLHIKDAQLVDQQNVKEFIAQTDKALPLIVYCYHGNSSQSASQFFAEQGFTEVYSMDGGFEEWKSAYPETVQPK